MLAHGQAWPVWLLEADLVSTCGSFFLVLGQSRKAWRMSNEDSRETSMEQVGPHALSDLSDLV